MADRPKHHADEELIDKAYDVCQIKGYYAASIQDFKQAMNIEAWKLLPFFPMRKIELYQKTLKQFLEKSIKVFYGELDKSQNPIQFNKKNRVLMPLIYMQLSLIGTTSYRTK